MTLIGRHLILASASSRRQELLAQIGVSFSVISADLDESRQGNEPIPQYVARLSLEKARMIFAKQTNDVAVLGADTAVAVAKELLAKPENLNEARYMLKRLSGNTHWVHTGVTVVTSDMTKTLVVSTQLKFCELSESMINAYLNSDEWQGKAGGYAIQGLAGRFVTHLHGSYSAVVGLPLYEAAELLTEAKVSVGVTYGH